MNGWIKIHRKICEHWIWGNPVYLKWWLDLIILANHKPVTVLINGSLTLIEQGMYHTSILSLSERWSAHRKTVNGFLKLLEDEAMITTEKNRRDGTTINICNYAAYQDFSIDTCPSNGHRTSTFDKKYGEKNTSKNVQNGTTDKADNCAVNQGFFNSEGQLDVQLVVHPSGQPNVQPAGHKQEVKNDKNDQEKKETNTCPSKMGGYAQVDFLSEAGGAAPAGKKQKSGDMPKQMQDAFDAFWAAYPKKVSKGDARKAWKQIQPDSELLTKMLTALGRAKTCQSWMNDGGKYIPHPAKWLRDERWEDVIVPTQRAAPRPQRRET